MIDDKLINNFLAVHTHTLGHLTKLPGTKVIRRKDITELLTKQGYRLNVKTLNVAVREFSAYTKAAGVCLVPKFRQGKSYLSVKGCMLFLMWLSKLENLNGHIEVWELTYLEQAAKGRESRKKRKADLY